MSGPADDLNPPPPARSGKRWVFIGLVLLAVLLLACGGLCGGCMLVGNRMTTTAFQMKELADLQRRALPSIETNEEVRAKLGSVTSVDLPQLDANWSPDAATVTTVFGVAGETGSGTATVTGTRSSGRLAPTTIVVLFPDGTSVEVPHEARPPEPDL